MDESLASNHGVSKNRLNRRHFTAASAGAAAFLAGSRAIRSQDATPVGTPTGGTAGIQMETLASGLASPRFVVADGNTIYFTESGTGGETAVFENAGEGTPPAQSPVSATGLTGSFSKLEADGTVSVVADQFRSYTFGANGEIVGAAGLALDGHGKAYIAVGAPGPFISTIDLTGEEDVLYEVDLSSGEKRIIADLGQYELERNPDPVAIDSNLYGAVYHDGTVFVADSGGNDILAIDIASGEVSTFAVTGGLPAPFLPETGNPLRDGAREIDSVPAGIVLGPDDRLYVSYVTGGPFPTGIAPVDAFALDGTKSTYATGLTMVGDLAFSSDGTLYACIISSDFVTQAPGQVIRVSPDGNHSIVVDNLLVPNGICFDADDNLYVLNKVTGIPGGGELLKFTGVTAAPGDPMAPPGAGTPGAGDASPEASPIAAAEPVTVLFQDIEFVPATVTIPAGTDVVFTFENRGFLAHDFAIDDPHVFSGVLEGGQSTKLVVNLPAGTYTYYCTQVGHRASGMVGTLTAG